MASFECSRDPARPSPRAARFLHRCRCCQQAEERPPTTRGDARLDAGVAGRRRASSRLARGDRCGVDLRPQSDRAGATEPACVADCTRARDLPLRLRCCCGYGSYGPASRASFCHSARAPCRACRASDAWPMLFPPRGRVRMCVIVSETLYLVSASTRGLLGPGGADCHAVYMRRVTCTCHMCV